jgi:hypothetical protein
MKRIILAVIVLCALAGAAASAQQTTGNINGRIVDAQGAAVPGATVTARSAQTGFVRTDVSDGEGLYRLSALPVGNYEVSAELSGFATWTLKDVTVNVAQTTDLNIDLKLAGLTEAVNVIAEVSLVKSTDSSVGGVVDVTKIESMPLNGRPIRESRHHDSGRRARLPLRSDQDDAVLAADCRGQWPERELPD